MYNIKQIDYHYYHELTDELNVLEAIHCMELIQIIDIIPSGDKKKMHRANCLMRQKPNLDNTLTPYKLMRIHSELSYKEAESLMEFTKSKTITNIECYGNGSAIYPQWKKANK